MRADGTRDRNTQVGIVSYGTLLVAVLGLVACGSDATSPDTTSDTIVDTSDDVDSSPPDTTPDIVEDSVVATDTGTDTVGPSAKVVVNEVSMNDTDWVELYNAGDATADISGWLMRDNDPTHAYIFGANTLVPAGVYLLIARSDDGFDFGLGAGDSVLLYDGDTLIDSTAWTEDAVTDGFTWGRFPNGDGAFGVLFDPTPGAANRENVAVVCPDGVKGPSETCDGDDFGDVTCENRGYAAGTLACVDDCTRIDFSACTARAAGLVINEVTSKGDDEIELFNGTSAALDLLNFTLTDDGGNSYVLPSTALAAGDYLVIAKTEHGVGLGDADSLTLTDASERVVDSMAWPVDAADPSWCRSPNGTGGFKTCDALTLGATNTP